MFYEFARFVVGIYAKIAYRLIVTGKENIPVNKGFILASNHITNLDPIFVGLNVPGKIHFMAKSELFKNKIFAFIITKLGAFHIKRGTGEIAQLDYSVDLIKSNKIIGIFPEGTRSKTGELLKAKSGVLVITAKSGGDILPACIKLEKRKFRRKTIYVSYGNIINSSEINIDDVHSLHQIKTAGKLLMSKIQYLLDNLEMKN